MNGYTRQKNGGSEQGNTWKGGWNWRSVCGLDSYYNQRILVFNSIYSNTCFSFPFYPLAQTNEGKDAHPLLGECWQSPPVPERAKSAPGKHGISRYRGWESQAHTWPYLDYYPEIPGKDVEIHTFSFPYLERRSPELRGEERFTFVVLLSCGGSQWEFPLGRVGWFYF